MAAPRRPFVSSALDDVHREAALAGLLVLRHHVEAGLAHGLDTVIETMRQTGHDMMTKYKETSEGGHAVNVNEC